MGITIVLDEFENKKEKNSDSDSDSYNYEEVNIKNRHYKEVNGER